MRKRHWRMRWDPEAKLVFTRRMRCGPPSRPYYLPGETVPKKIRDRIGENRLRRWFETGVVEIKDWTPPEPAREKALREKRELDERQDAALRVNDPDQLRGELEGELPPPADEPELATDPDSLREGVEGELPPTAESELGE